MEKEKQLLQRHNGQKEGTQEAAKSEREWVGGCIILSCMPMVMPMAMTKGCSLQKG